MNMSIRLPDSLHNRLKQMAEAEGISMNQFINLFKDLADETGIPYKSLINLYLRDCVQTKKKLKWAS